MYYLCMVQQRKVGNDVTVPLAYGLIEKRKIYKYLNLLYVASKCCLRLCSVKPALLTFVQLDLCGCASSLFGAWLQWSRDVAV